MTLRTDWRRKPDGPMFPLGDEGRVFRVNQNHGARPSVSGGALVGNLPDRESATYVQQAIATKMRRIGAEFGFESGSTDGSLTFAAWVLGAGRPSTHCHVAFAPDRWIASTVENGEVSEYASEPYAIPLLPDGNRYRAEVVFMGSSAFITLPDGSTVTAADEAVERLDGTVPCWEFYRGAAGGAAVRLYEIWAG